MSRREPMAPVEGLKKPTLPPPTARPRTLIPVPTPDPKAAEKSEMEPQEGADLVAPKETPNGSDQVGETDRPKVARARRPKTEKAVVSGRSASADTMRPVSVSVPLTLAEAWRDRAKRDRTSQVDVLLDAIVAHQGDLDELVVVSSTKPTVNDGLFDRGAGPTGERFVGVSLRIKSGNLAVIDQLADKHGAKKRSPFVAAVLTAYLA